MDDSLTAARVLDALSCRRPGCPCVISARRGFGVTHCPLPDHGQRLGDRRPSLAVRPGERVALVTCFAGCPRDALVATLRERLTGDELASWRSVRPTRLSVTPALIGDLWSEALPHHPRLVTYLQFRGLTGAVPTALRLHPRLRYCEPPEATRWLPAMVARFQRPDGSVTGLHRTYLDPSGPGKAEVRSPKRFLGRVAGAAVHLGEPGHGRLAVAEGIETGLAVQEARGVSVWAAGSARGLAALELPCDLTLLEVWADSDPPGLDAAGDLARRARRLGIAVGVFVPPEEGAA
jgi:hypothetical protein